MGYYVNVEAKAGCAEKINDLWTAAGFKDWLIWTPPRIQDEIKALHENPDFAHLSYVQTVEDWDKTFPIMAENRGQIFIGSVGFDADERPEEAAELRRQVQFVLDNRFLFARISGLGDAETALEMDVPGDYIEGDGVPRQYEGLSFMDLPVRSSSPIYRLCVQYNRPGLWRAWVAFEEAPSDSTWTVLRHYTVPWRTAFSQGGSGGDSVWALAERQATQRDGKDFGLEGRYRDGRFPSVLDVRRALKAVKDPAPSV